MGHPEKSVVTGKDGSGTGPAGGAPMSPVRAFLLLLALLVLAGVVLLMTTRPERAEPIQMERSQGAGDNGVTQEGPRAGQKSASPKPKPRRSLSA